MSGLILDIFDVYSKQLMIRMASFIEFIFCIFILTIPFKKTKKFAMKLCVIASFVLPFILLVSILNFHSSQIYVGVINIFIYSFVLISLYILYKETFSEIFLCLCGGIAIQIIVGRLYEIFIIIFHQNPYETLWISKNIVPIRDWALYFLIHFFFSLILALIFHRKRVYEHDKSNKVLIISFSISFVLVTVILTSVSRSFEGENSTLDFIIRIFSILYALLTLLLRTRILETSKLKQDLLIMDELLHSEKKQFDSMRTEIEIINMKTHDLRQQLSNISYKLTHQELEALTSAVEVYDTTIKTGNDILDVILYRKQLFCKKNNIRMSCLADGHSLSFISPTHLYSLLSNAIENSLEAVQLVSNEEKRLISISIGRENGVIGIHITNYFIGDINIRDQMPQTIKKDNRHHGFGIKSMQHIAKQYDGTLSFHIEEDIFFLHIYIPNC